MFSKLTPRIHELEYAIRDVVVEAKKVEKAGRKIIPLNIGDPLKYDFDVPEELKEYMVEAIKDGFNYYGDSLGEEDVGQAISYREKAFNNISIDPETIIVGNGVSEVFLMISAALFQNGEELLIPGPSYPIYTSYPKLFGGRPVEYRCDESDGWQPDIDDIRSKITEKTVGIVIINPNNPTGAVYDEKTIKEIADIAKEHNLLLFSDEIYDHNVLEGSFKSTSAIVKDYPVIGLNGISKSYLATGWRMGYMYIANPDEKVMEFKNAVAKMARARLCPVLPVQKAAKKLMLKEPLYFKGINEKYKKRRDLMVKRFNEINGFSVVKPKGAFYMFPRLDFSVLKAWKDDRDFVYSLLRETGVLTVFGSGFGKYGKDHIRTVYLPPESVINEAMDKIEEFVNSHK